MTHIPHVPSSHPNRPKPLDWRPGNLERMRLRVKHKLICPVVVDLEDSILRDG